MKLFFLTTLLTATTFAQTEPTTPLASLRWLLGGEWQTTPGGTHRPLRLVRETYEPILGGKFVLARQFNTPAEGSEFEYRVTIWGDDRGQLRTWSFGPHDDAGTGVTTIAADGSLNAEWAAEPMRFRSRMAQLGPDKYRSQSWSMAGTEWTPTTDQNWTRVAEVSPEPTSFFVPPEGLWVPPTTMPSTTQAVDELHTNPWPKPLVGTWVGRGTWAGGKPFEATTTYRPIGSGEIVLGVSTLPDGSERSRSVIVAKGGTLKQWTFQPDGQVREATGRAGMAFVTTRVQSTAEGTTIEVTETFVPQSDGTLRWTVTMKRPDGVHTLVEADWSRQ